MSESFLCAVCNVNKRSTVKRIREFKLCGDCYNKINEDYRRNRVPKPELQTTCMYCGAQLNHRQKSPTCSKHRAKWYREQELREEIQAAIEKKDILYLEKHSLIKFKELGFKYEEIFSVFLQTISV